MIIHLYNQHYLVLMKTLLLPTTVSLVLLDSTRHPMWRIIILFPVWGLILIHLAWGIIIIHPVCSHLAGTKLGRVIISMKHPFNYQSRRIDYRRKPRIPWTNSTTLTMMMSSLKLTLMPPLPLVLSVVPNMTMTTMIRMCHSVSCPTPRG